MSKTKDLQITTRIYLKGLDMVLENLKTYENQNGIGACETLTWAAEVEEIGEKSKNPIVKKLCSDLVKEIYKHTKKYPTEKTPRKRKTKNE